MYKGPEAGMGMYFCTLWLWTQMLASPGRHEHSELRYEDLARTLSSSLP